MQLYQKTLAVKFDEKLEDTIQRFKKALTDGLKESIREEIKVYFTERDRGVGNGYRGVKDESNKTNMADY